MKLTIYILSLLSFFSCSKQELTMNGNWRVSITLQDRELPVIISLKQNDQLLSGHLVNSSEKIELSGKIINNKFDIEIGSHYAKLSGGLSREGITGKWIRTNKENYAVAFSGVKSSMTELYKSYESETNLLDISGKWKINLSETKLGLGLFKQTGSRVQGSILTNTGDYRFLDGFIKNDKVLLTGFDGVFALVIEMVISNKKIFAQMYSGKSSHSTFSGIKDETFELMDPNQITKTTHSKPIKLVVTDISGAVIDINKGEYKNKAKVIQLFGSWCPNCVDETHFFRRWQSENIQKSNQLKFIALAFESTQTKSQAIKNLRKAKAKLKVSYPFVLADFNQSKSISDYLPIEKVLAYPTTIFVNKKNQIIKIHTGFAGQATGSYFSSFESDFNKTVQDLLK